MDDVKPGFQQTEVGVIPEDWNVSTIGDEFTIQLGKMLDAEKNSGTPAPYLGNRAVQWGKIDLTGLGIVPMSRDDLRKYKLQKGDLLACEGGEVGRAAIWNDELPDCYYQKALHRLRSKGRFLAPLLLSLLYFYSRSGVFENYVTQTSIAHLPKDKFETIPIPSPTLDEQEAIAEALSDADGLIESLEQLIAKKRLLKQGAMQELLTGKKRLPGFEGECKMKESEIGLIASDWQLMKMSNLTTQIIDGTHHTPQYTESGIPFLRVTDIQSSKIDQGQLKFVSVEEHQVLTKRCKPEKGDLLLSKNGTIGIPKIVDWDWEFSIFVSLALLKLVDSKIQTQFLDHFIRSDFLTDQIRRKSKQGTVTNLHLEEIREFLIPLPPSLAEQTAIAEVLSDMDAEITALEAKLAKARRIKEGMMQELLTGKTRLV